MENKSLIKMYKWINNRINRIYCFDYYYYYFEKVNRKDSEKVKMMGDKWSFFVLKK